MHDHYVEKKFLYLLIISLLLHLGVLALVLYLPRHEKPLPKEPLMIDLQPDTEIRPNRLPQRKVPRLSDRRARVEREMAPRGTDRRDSLPPPAPPVTRQPPQVSTAPSVTEPSSRPVAPAPVTPKDNQVAPGSSKSGLLKPKGRGSQQKPQPQLFPGAERMARLEESYRRRFEGDVAEGVTRFLNSDDIQFGSFLRHFENSVYGVWRYPAEAARNGIEGVVPVKITFNNKGEIVHVELLETSGAKVLDEEVFRTLKAIGPVGSFPKGYDKETFNLIAFFQYGMARRLLR